MKFFIYNSIDTTYIISCIDNNISDFIVSPHNKEFNFGDIYIGAIRKLNKKNNSAFIDIGDNRAGYINLKESNIGKNPIVQIIKTKNQSKGALLSTNIRLPGKYLVLLPLTEKIHLSQKINDNENHLKAMMHDIASQNKYGCILRTAGETISRNEIEEEYNRLSNTWDHIKSNAFNQNNIQCLHKADPIVIQMLNDLSIHTTDIITNDHSLSIEIEKHFPNNHISSIDLLNEISNSRIIESITNSIQQTFVTKSGIKIIIEPTQALTAIDIDSHSCENFNHLDVNLEAAANVAKLIRTKNISGIIVVDFIDLESEEEKIELSQCFERCLKLDHAKIKIDKINNFGQITLTRSSKYNISLTKTDIAKYKLILIIMLKIINQAHSTNLQVNVHTDIKSLLEKNFKEVISVLEIQKKISISIIEKNNIDIYYHKIEKI